MHAYFYVSKPECMSCQYGVHEVGERVCVCERERERERGGDIFSVCIPGNRSAALLNNETSAYMYVCVGWWETKAMIQGSWKELRCNVWRSLPRRS